MKRLRALRVWVRKFAKATTATSLAEMKEEVEVLLDEYEEHMKLHRMKVNKGETQTLVTVAGKVAEDFIKLKWGELAKLPFILRERKLSLLEAEANAPNRELAFISMAKSRFSRWQHLYDREYEVYVARVLTGTSPNMSSKDSRGYAAHLKTEID